MTAIRVVAFDLGGVLVDVDLAVLPRALGREAARVEEALFGGDRHERLSTGALGAEPFVREAARALDVDEDQIRAAWGDVVRARDGARALVERVRARAVAWSNTDPIHVARLAPTLSPRLFDEGRALSYEIAAMKPARAFTERAVARLGVAPSEIFFVDDRAENVAAARAAGVEAAVTRSIAETAELLSQRGLLDDA